jgi:Arc/MetJ-type ribon-helix-helix transcriptional regulator
METISLRLENNFARILEKAIKNNMYSTKTEFIREAIRDKIKQIEKEETLKKVEKLFGSSKRKTTDEELHKAREKAFEQLERKHGLR